jgi:spore coat protein H
MNRLCVLRPYLRSKTSLLLALALALPLLASCKGLRFNEEDSYGLKLVTLDISPEEYGLLNSQLQSKRPAQVEIRVAGEFKVFCSVSYAGRSSLDAYRKSYDLSFCDRRYNARSSYRLSAQFIDKTMARSLIGYEIFQSLGLSVPKCELATAYINRKYHGVYLFMETIDTEFYDVRKVATRELYKAQYGNASFRTDWASRISEAFDYDGKGEDNFTYLNEIYKILYNESQPEVFARKLETFFDIDSFLSYTAAALSINHWDGFDNNYYLVFDTGRKKLTTTPWDLDRIWEKPNDYSPDGLLERNALLARLLKIDAYRRTFIQKLMQINTEFPPEKLIERVKAYEAHASLAYSEDPILSRYKSSAFDELEKNILIWDEKIKEFLNRNPL